MKKKRHIIDSPSFFVGKSADGLISFGSGQPDLPPPQEIYNILPSYHSFKYGLIQGQENLRSALAREYKGATGDDFVVTNGASEALDLAFRVIRQLSKKRYVLLPRPYYYSYPYIIRFAGLTPLYTDLVEGRLDMVDVRKKIGKCAAVLINSPSNPTGRIEAIDSLKEVEMLSKKYGIYVISDEVYKDLIYERENYLISGKHVVTINSFSKTYAMCGFRVGYIYSPDEHFIQRVIEMKVHTSMNTSIIAQEMAYAATTAPQSYHKKQLAVWRERRDSMYQGLRDLGLDVWKPEGAFYVLPKMKHSNKVVNDLFYDHKVITYDGAWFGAPDRIRLSYALDKEKIEEGLRRMRVYLKKHQDYIL